jgi:hypothetical protein
LVVLRGFLVYLTPFEMHSDYGAFFFNSEDLLGLLPIRLAMSLLMVASNTSCFHFVGLDLENLGTEEDGVDLVRQQATLVLQRS